MPSWTHTPVSQELIVAVGEATTQNVRAFKIESDKKRPRCIIAGTYPATSSLPEDLEALAPMFQAAFPALFMVRLTDTAKTLPDCTDKDWGLLAWVPEDAPTGLKLKVEGLLQSVRNKFDTLNSRSVHFTTRTDDLSKALLERLMAKRESIKERERHEEQKLERKLTQVEEQAEKIKFAIGIAGLTIEPQDSFKKALALVLTEGKGTVKATLTGEDSENLEGEVLDFVKEASQLKGHLPADRPCYVLMLSKPSEEDAKKLCLIVWLPEGTDMRLNVVFSATKASVLAALFKAIKEQDYDCELTQAEVHHEEELAAELNVVDVEVGELNSPRLAPERALSKATIRSKQSHPRLDMGDGSEGDNLKKPSKAKRNPKYRRSTYLATKGGGLGGGLVAGGIKEF